MRPWVLIGEHGDTKIFMVAVAEESLSIDLDTPPARLLSVVKALGEEQRLRMLRRLAAGGPASLQQLADHIGVAKSTAHHHLVQLRAAGLAVVELGEDKEYRVREGLAGDVAHLLDTYLRGGAR
jgi:DNA-binding transcriptional ArsR family regulator